MNPLIIQPKELSTKAEINGEPSTQKTLAAPQIRQNTAAAFICDALLIRPAVIWRRTSFGSQTEAGSNFVARMLTVVTTLKSQHRNVLEFMTQAVVAARGGKTAPSLLPEVVSSDDDCDLLKAA